MPQSRQLNPRQQAFAREYVANGGNATQAAVAAGYSHATVDKSAKRLTEHAGIRGEIDRRQRALEVRSDYTVDMWRANLLSDLDGAREAGNWSAVMKSHELLGRHLGALQTDQQSEGGKQMLACLGAWAAGKLDARPSEPPVLEARVTEVRQG